ncbi:hypothetical protein GCM10023206_17090 [Acinetobacter puyangensis]|uniref:Lipoprotein n=1 Tax=Acinetobacter puyangensis TaxID=1096779 RepID=A0A240E5K2_9GAMM|nr:hypothetical protein [Acinetobacter puyangensis]SNX44028.1 hypothetical protein SAMN05421731_102186 [Acinetobacter puyangensis]
MNIKTVSIVFALCASLVLAGCGKNEQQQEIRPAQKLSNDASAVANEAWILINQLDQILYSGEKDNLNEMVRKPLRELSTRWRIEVKMTDAVTEGKYALCRKSLTSLDAWTRSIDEHSIDIEKRKADYERDKALCKNAIEHPELGNTSPKLTHQSLGNG